MIDCEILNAPEILKYQVSTTGEMSAHLSNNNHIIQCINKSWEQNILFTYYTKGNLICVMAQECITNTEHSMKINHFHER